ETCRRSYIDESLVDRPQNLQGDFPCLLCRQGRRPDHFAFLFPPSVAIFKNIDSVIKNPAIALFSGLWVLTSSARHRFDFSSRWSTGNGPPEPYHPGLS